MHNKRMQERKLAGKPQKAKLLAKQGIIPSEKPKLPEEEQKRLDSELRFWVTRLWRSTESLERMIKAGANMNAKDDNGDTAFLLLSGGHAETDELKLFISHGADVNTSHSKYGWTPLMQTFSQKNAELLIKSGAKVNAKDKQNMTPLIHGALNGATGKCRVLLENGAKMEEKDRNGKTALMWAAERGYAEICVLLIEKGAKADKKDPYGNTALMIAAKNGRIHACAFLAKISANIEEKDEEGKTALLLAAEMGQIDVCRLLLKKGADINAKDNIRRTALMLAAHSGHAETCALMVENGATFMEKRPENFSFLHSASASASSQASATVKKARRYSK